MRPLIQLLIFGWILAGSWHAHSQSPSAPTTNAAPQARKPNDHPNAVVFKAETGAKATAPVGTQFIAESVFQTHGVAHSGTVLFGPSLLKEFSLRHFVGVRALLSIGSTGAYQFTGLYRYLLGDGLSRFYLEANIGFDIVDYRNTDISMGAVLGFLHNLTPELSLGGSAGIEFFNRGSIVAGGFRLGPASIVPKASLMLSVVL